MEHLNIGDAQIYKMWRNTMSTHHVSSSKITVQRTWTGVRQLIDTRLLVSYLLLRTLFKYDWLFTAWAHVIAVKLLFIADATGEPMSPDIILPEEKFKKKISKTVLVTNETHSQNSYQIKSLKTKIENCTFSLTGTTTTNAPFRVVDDEYVFHDMII